MESRPPDSLKADARPIAFTLHDTTVEGPPLTLPLFVRPEDLSITYPSRLAITQTFGEDGAWADSFGAGVNTITLSGVTGWRGARQFGGDDGYEHFVKVHKTIFANWHKLRANAAAAGNDPDKILLILSDGLDNLNWVVAPQNFTLKRNKSRPLLAQYNITMHRLSGDAAIKPNPPPSLIAQKQFAFDSLEASLRSIQDFADNLSQMISDELSPIKGAIEDFVKLTARIARAVIGAVKAVVGVVKGTVGELVGMAQNIMRAGMNITQTVAAVTTMPQQIKAQFQKLGSAYTNMLCVLKNVFRKRSFLPDYDIYGAGNCSSTSGGHGVSRYVSENTFAAVLKTDKATVTTSSDGAAAINRGAAMDPTVTTPADAAATASAIAGGVQVE